MNFIRLQYAHNKSSELWWRTWDLKWGSIEFKSYVLHSSTGWACMGHLPLWDISFPACKRSIVIGLHCDMAAELRWNNCCAHCRQLCWASAFLGMVLAVTVLTALGSWCLLWDLCTFSRALLCSTVAGDFDRGDFLEWPFLHLLKRIAHILLG